MTSPKSKEIEVLGAERRRRWAASEKLAMVRETYEPGMTVSLVARQHGINPWIGAPGTPPGSACMKESLYPSSHLPAHRELRRVTKPRSTVHVSSLTQRVIGEHTDPCCRCGWRWSGAHPGSQVGAQTEYFDGARVVLEERSRQSIARASLLWLTFVYRIAPRPGSCNARYHRCTCILGIRSLCGFRQVLGLTSS